MFDFCRKSVPVQCALIIYEISIYQKKIEHLDATEKFRKKNVVQRVLFKFQ